MFNPKDISKTFSDKAQAFAVSGAFSGFAGKGLSDFIFQATFNIPEIPANILGVGVFAFMMTQLYPPVRDGIAMHRQYRESQKSSPRHP